MPSIFKVIDGEMNRYFNGKRLEDTVPNLPPGRIEYGERWVTSKPISLPDTNSTCFVKGKFDTVVKFDDGTYGVIDFKTSKIKPENVGTYGRQLHAYAHALENPAPGAFSVKPISKLGLLVYEPSTFSANTADSAVLSGEMNWTEIPRDDKAFFKFLKEVLAVLESPEPPEGACEWCQYRDKARNTRL